MKVYKLFFILFVISICLPEFLQATSSPKDWHKSYSTQFQGVNSKEAIEFLKKNKLVPSHKIIVGIIDSGIDTAVVDLKNALWINSIEKLDGKDNDKNGFIDDIYGWNFLGTSDNSFNMISAGTQEYREFKRLYTKYKDIDSLFVSNDAEYVYYQKMKKKAGIESYLRFFELNKVKNQAYQIIQSKIDQIPTLNIDTLTIRGLLGLSVPGEDWENACMTILTDFYRSGMNELWNNVSEAHRNEFELMEKRIWGIENEADKRLKIGDNMNSIEDRFYGNSTLQIEGFDHGTIVAGAIAGQGVSDANVTGIYPDAKLMIIRAIPNGDEYDKDVASAIYYAVDNGAKVINLSAGKYTSVRPDMVNNAITYAAKKDVLIVQAAGNNGLNIDSVTYFPTARDRNGELSANFLRVGASNNQGKKSSFSNYGNTEVNVFAPGEKIWTVTVNNEYTESQGTSIAAPIVSGVAALIRDYFPHLKAAQVKEILMKSTVPAQDEKISGGIVNALEAVKLAINYK